MDQIATGRHDAALGVERQAADAAPLVEDALDPVVGGPAMDAALEDVAEPQPSLVVAGGPFDEPVAGGQLFHACGPPPRSPRPSYSLPARSTNSSSAAGLARDSRLAALSAGVPMRIFLTGISSALPLRVRGTSGMAWIAFGTWRGEQSSRRRFLIAVRRSSVSSTPSSRTTNSGMKFS